MSRVFGQVIEGDCLKQRDLGCPYAVRTLPLTEAPVHISTLGDRDGHGKGLSPLNSHWFRGFPPPRQTHLQPPRPDPEGDLLRVRGRLCLPGQA